MTRIFRSCNIAMICERRWKWICTNTTIHVGEGRQIFVPPFLSEEAALEGIVDMDIGGEHWKKMFSEERKKETL